MARPVSITFVGRAPLDMQQSIGSGNVNVNVTLDEAGVATLSGYTDSISRIAAERAAERSPEVRSVINLLKRT